MEMKEARGEDRKKSRRERRRGGTERRAITSKIKSARKKRIRKKSKTAEPVLW